MSDNSKLKRQFPLEHWMVCGEWNEVVEIPRQDGIVGEPQRFIQPKKVNEVINVHPVVHIGRILRSDSRMDYAITFAMPISKFYFDMVVPLPSEVEQRVADISAEEAAKER